MTGQNIHRGKRIPGLVSIPSIPDNVCRIESGTYTGDGTASHVINLADSSLKVLWITIYEQGTGDSQRRAITETTNLAVDDHVDGIAYQYVDGANPTVMAYTSRIIALGTGSFTVDSAWGTADPNNNGVVYYYVVMGTH